jgi:FMN-dependent NADH-azoreductase
MKTILQVNNSVFGDDGVSSRLADTFVAQERARPDEVRVIRRNLGDNPVPHLNATRFQAALTAPDERTAEQAREAAIADELVEEVLAADVLVIGVPVYNFQVPSPLKAWFDHVARAGTTFRYTENGPEGLLKGRKAYVFIASGGQYEGTDMDFVEPYLRHMLGFLGIDEVVFTRAEGMAMGEETSQQALVDANQRISALAA